MSPTSTSSQVLNFGILERVRLGVEIVGRGLVLVERRGLDFAFVLAAVFFRAFDFVLVFMAEHLEKG